MKYFQLNFLVLLSILFIACNDQGNDSGNGNGTNTPSVPSISHTIIASHPHDTSYFTQGLEFYNNTLLESTGLNGRSRLIQTEPATGKVLNEVKLDPKYFGEGLTVLRDTVYQLTWQQNVVLVYNASDFKKIGELPLTGEGWGITNNGTHLIVSNGSSDLFFYEPSTFKLLRTITVKENGSFVPNLNELEYVNGFVYANLWQTNYIVKIDPNTENVVGKMDLSEIARQEKAVNPHAEYLNGIAYNAATQKFHITGKNWSRIYVLQLGSM